MPQKGFVNATWVGPFEAHLPDGTHLMPGETTVAIPKGEADASDHWKITGGKPSAEAIEAAEDRAGITEDGS